MKVLFVSSEITPWVKTGGLGDVASALPQMLFKQGCDIKVLIPGYPAIKNAFPSAIEIARPHFLGGELPSCVLLSAKTPEGLPIYILDFPSYYEREGNPYIDVESGKDWHDNHLRFGLLSRVAAWLGSSVSTINWHPDLIHCNDWQSGLTPAYLKYLPNTRKCKTLITVHNLAFQGIFPQNLMGALALPDYSWSIGGVEFYGNISFLKAGLQLADYISTVSETYAQEIQTPEFGCGLELLLKYRQKNLIGIVNGVDENWSPQSDKYLTDTFVNFNCDNFQTQKSINRSALRQKLGLENNPDKPIFAVVSRLSPQKGLDLLVEIADKIINLPAQLVILGSGDKVLENKLQQIAQKYPGQCSLTLGFNEALAHQITAGSDMFIMPSRFEPCGLNQMYSQLYGTIPIVGGVGGLKDTVIGFSSDDINTKTISKNINKNTSKNLQIKNESGFVLTKTDSAELLKNIIFAHKLWRNKTLWHKLINNAINRNFSWQASANKYLTLYQEIINS